MPRAARRWLPEHARLAACSRESGRASADRGRERPHTSVDRAWSGRARDRPRPARFASSPVPARPSVEEVLHVLGIFGGEHVAKGVLQRRAPGPNRIALGVAHDIKPDRFVAGGADRLRGDHVGSIGGAKGEFVSRFEIAALRRLRRAHAERAAQASTNASRLTVRTPRSWLAHVESGSMTRHCVASTAAA